MSFFRISLVRKLAFAQFNPTRQVTRCIDKKCLLSTFRWSPIAWQRVECGETKKHFSTDSNRFKPEEEGTLAWCYISPQTTRCLVFRALSSPSTCFRDCIPIPPTLKAIFREVETWSNAFSAKSVPFETFEVRFSRSSGPGGQNVNKVNSKAEVRFSLEDAVWIHPWVKQQIKNKFPRYLSSSGEVIISSDTHRTQKHNIEECRKRLLELIEMCARVPSATSEEQTKRVQRLAQVSELKRKEAKEKLKSKKSERRKSSGGDGGKYM